MAICCDRYVIILVALIGLQTILLSSNAWENSPTLNEPAHLASGLHHWETGDFSMYSVNPPLIRLVAALPVKFVGYQSDWSMFFTGVGARPEFEVGKSFITSNKERSWMLFWLARTAVIPFSLLGTFVCFVWTRELSGSQLSGLIAASLWAFDPFTLGHGCLLTPDSHASALGAVAGFTFWKWLKTPSWIGTVVSGIALGLAVSSKTTMIVLLPLWPILWMMYRFWPFIMRGLPWSNRLNRDHILREITMLLVKTAVGLAILNVCYLGQGFGTDLGDYRFMSSLFTGVSGATDTSADNRFEHSSLAWIPIPLPKQYVIGIDMQRHDFENYAMPSYVAGQWRNKGWWWYYGYVLLVKLPFGTLTLSLIGVFICAVKLKHHFDQRSQLGGGSENIRTFGSASDLLVTIAPALIIFFVVSLQSGFSEHGRYILPCLPFLCVSIGFVTGMNAPVFKSKKIYDGCWFRIAAIVNSKSRLRIALTFIVVLESLAVWPFSLAFFNLPSGGKNAGPTHLLGSNLDWGQDLGRLNDWVRKKGERTVVHLAFNEAMYNVWDLADESIISWPMDLQVQTGSNSSKKIGAEEDFDFASSVNCFYAVSIGLLYGSPDSIRRSDNTFVKPDVILMSRLRDMEPAARVGQTIRLFTNGQVRSALSN